jgi:hypothetical protein
VLDTKSPKYLEMAQGHISLSIFRTGNGVFYSSSPKIQKLFLKTKNHFNILWFTVVRFEKPIAFLLKNSRSSSTAAELSS